MLTSIVVVLCYFTILFFGALMIMLLAGRFMTFVPYVPMPAWSYDEIVRALRLKPRQIFYDFGCGDGRIVRAVANADPRVDARGVELTPFVYCLARLKQFLYGGAKYRIERRNFNDIRLDDINRLFLYLWPSVVIDLLPKLERELPKGARVVSCDFPLTPRAPNETIKIGKFTLYCYDF